MSKTIFSIIAAFLILTGSWYFVSRDADSTDRNSPIGTLENSDIRDGVQYITINARGGYTPKLSTAQAGIPTKLIVKTKGTFDCSSSLVIKSLGYRNTLPSTGETEIAIGTPVAGDVLRATCGMGMYSFAVNFN